MSAVFIRDRAGWRRKRRVASVNGRDLIRVKQAPAGQRLHHRPDGRCSIHEGPLDAALLKRLHEALAAGADQIRYIRREICRRTCRRGRR